MSSELAHSETQFTVSHEARRLLVAGARDLAVVVNGTPCAFSTVVLDLVVIGMSLAIECRPKRCATTAAMDVGTPGVDHGAAALGGEDDNRQHRPGLRLRGDAYPAPQAVGLHQSLVYTYPS